MMESICKWRRGMFQEVLKGESALYSFPNLEWYYLDRVNGLLWSVISILEDVDLYMLIEANCDVTQLVQFFSVLESADYSINFQNLTKTSFWQF